MDFETGALTRTSGTVLVCVATNQACGGFYPQAPLREDNRVAVSSR